MTRSAIELIKAELEQAQDRLKTVISMLRAAEKQRDAAQATIKRLKEAARATMKLCDDGLLVRDISNDSNSTAFIQQATRIISTLNELRKAVEGEE